jgi:hypothetical protein
VTRQPRRKSCRVPRRLFLALGALLVSGCSGWARVHVIPAEVERMSPHRPLVKCHDLSEAYFWLNQDNELCVALSRGSAEKRQAFDLSLVLPEEPAGPGRYYQVNRRTLRALIRDGGPPRRYGSYRGMVRVWYDEGDPDVLNGRFRIWANEQEYKFWMDYWTNDREVMLVGEFKAVRDPVRGGEVLGRTEAEELKRGPPVGRLRPVTGPPIAPEPEQQP